ncbi:Flagellar hook-associated protein FlgL [hydrothermal vent metagenome]|uniref:Flagellar hook-associated protein FlgL n=1 Tax=hydrothermal vent metagenome TaxID=652676 RepID=A0A3B1CPC0_9ZZZZ
MIRITNRMMYNNTLVNAFRNNQGLLAAQEQISSGKRINRPSDDPAGMMEVLEFRSSIGKSERYIRVMNNAESFLNTADSTIGSVHDQLKSAKEQALSQAGGMATAETRKTAATLIDTMIEQMISTGNTRIGSRYIFAGQRSELPAIDSNGNYVGSGKDLRAEITNDVVIPISVRASEFLTADMNPAVSTSTTIASLNGGSGAPAGSFNITDRAGNTGAVTISLGDTIANVITAVAAAGTNITASVSSDGTALVLSDSTSPPVAPIIVQSNTTSQGLGIDGTRNASTFTGDALDPDIVSATLIADLYAGDGVTLNDIVLMNGGASSTVSFSSDTTVGNMISSINTIGGAMADTVTAAIDSTGRKLTITSGNANTVAFAKEAGSGNTAELLGIGGGRNVIPILQKFSAALKANDNNGIQAALGLLDTNMDTVNSVRGSIGARANQVINIRSSETEASLNSTKLKSFIEDADYIEAASELAMLQTAYQATLKSSAAIVQTSLLNFL